MNAILLVILLAHGGYWYGGADNTVTVHWAAPDANMPAATLSWQLMYDTVVVASGQADVAPGDKAATVTLKMPEARTLSMYAWKYQLKAKDTGKELESGQRAIYLCPPKMLAGQATRTKAKNIIVIDAQDEGLTAMLKAGGVDATRVAALGELQMRQADIILVAEDQLPENEVVQGILKTRAQAGASIMIFAQEKTKTSPKTSLGFTLAPRPLKGDLTWPAKHELFENLPAPQLNEWAREHSGDIKALNLPADAPVLELGCWPRETPGEKPVPIDALAATQTIGTGRIVWWQIPTGGFKKDDPRPQILLANALDYLLTRPEPTLPPSQRVPAPKAPKKPDPNTNTIIGEKP
jgi:hypothetical protein